MPVSKPIWPSLEALDALWASARGQAVAHRQAAWIDQVMADHVPARARILLIGPVAPALMETLDAARPNALFQAFPPAIGVRPGAVPAVLMDTDLPPFARASFDLVLISHILEFRSTPLALLSLAYEVLHPQGHLLTLVPHRLCPADLKVGYGASFVHMEMASLLRQSAFTPQRAGVARAGPLRPATLMNLSSPQYPPKPSGGRPVLASVSKLLAPRPAAGWASQPKI